MRRLTFFLFLWLFSVLSLQAESDLPVKIFRFIYNQQYDSAHILLNQYKAELDRFYYAILDIDLSYWENVTGTNNPDYSAFENSLLNYDLNEPSTREQSIIALIGLSYKLRYDLKRFHFISAMQTRRKTLVLYLKIKDDISLKSPEQIAIFRLYNALIAYFNQYPARYFSGAARAEMETAISEMELLNTSDSEIVKTLRAYFLGKIYLQYENAPEKALELFGYLTKNYPNNLNFKEYLKECN